MARPLRIEFPGAIYHITARGNARQNIYIDAADRHIFLDILGTACARYDWGCHAYCLMSNHFHLVVETRAATLSRGMRHLNGNYTQRFNYRHKCVGHILQGRFHAILIDATSYLLEVVRYTLLNPVRAGLVDTPEKWRWSSYRATIAGETAPAWLASDQVMRHFGVEMDTARKSFFKFMHDNENRPSIWNGLRQQMYLGDKEFVRSAQKHVRGNTADLREVPRVQRRNGRHALREILAGHTSRDDAMAAAFQTGLYTMREIAAECGVHYTTVSRAIRRVGLLGAGLGNKQSSKLHCQT